MKRLLEKLCRDRGITALYAFGSRAGEAAALVRGQREALAETDADLDLGILLRRGSWLDVRDKVRLAAALEDLFAAPRVDLVLLAGAPAFLAVEIVSAELLVDLDPDATAEFELYVLRRAGDLIGFERQRIQDVIRGGAR